METKTNDVVYAACQNGVILDVFPSEAEARDCIDQERQKDFMSIIFKRKLRKLFKKSGNVALHQYSILKIVEAIDFT